MSSRKYSFGKTMGLAMAEPTRTSDWVVVIGLGLAFLLYFVVRGWLNTALVLLCVFCLVQFALGRGALAPALAKIESRWLLAAFAAPILAVFAVQVSRHEFVPKYFDAPLRLLMSWVIFVYLLERRVNFVRIAELVFPVSVLSCAAVVFLYPGAASYFWEGRAATYFIDPLTLAQHITIAGFICLFCVDASGTDRGWQRLLKYSAFFAAIAVSLATRSRTGWTMVPILAGVWLIGLKRNNTFVRISLALLAVVAGCIAAYWTSDVVHTRVDMAAQEVIEYFSGGNRDTSTGIRLSLYRANWLLFLRSPLYGWGFEGTPALSSIPEIAVFLTPMAEGYFVHSGGHNELMQSMMRMGVLGLASRLLLFLVPLFLFAKAAGASLPRRRIAGYLGLTAVIGYMAASFSSEVFNLIYAASFYGLLVAALAATAFYEERS